MEVLLWQQSPWVVDSKFACEFLQVALEIVSVLLVALIETSEYGRKTALVGCPAEKTLTE
jgi:hypothetical protein